MAVDRRPELDLLVLYEVFVPRALRNQGYGGEALSAVEEMAVKERFSVVRIRQHPLDEDVDHDDLIRWYRRRGYRPDPSIASEMKKRVTRAGRS